MRAVSIVRDGDDGRLVVIETEDPTPAAGEILIDVVAAGVNRADTVQRRGRYEPPLGASPLPGLECSGTVRAVGADVTRWNVGDRVCALLAGGGYAEIVAVPEGQVFAIPHSVSTIEAAALPEALATAWSNLSGLGRLQPGEQILIHGGASGVGAIAIQLARMIGADALVTVGEDRKMGPCRDLGAKAAFNYRRGDFVEWVREVTGGSGADVILDVVGADYLQRNVAALANDGRLVLIGLQSGALAEVQLREVLRKRASITGSLLRPRSVAEKTQIIDDLVERVIPWVSSGEVRPVVDSVFTFDDAGDAHELIESSRHIGKIVLTPN